MKLPDITNLTKREFMRMRPQHKGRKWLRVGHVDPYETDSNRATVWALEGSPIRGWLIIYVGHADLLDGDGRPFASIESDHTVVED